MYMYLAEYSFDLFYKSIKILYIDPLIFPFRTINGAKKNIFYKKN